MTKDRKELLRRYLNFFFITLAVHAVSLLFYVVMLAAAMEHLMKSAGNKHVVLITAFSLVLLLIFLACLAVVYARNGEERRRYLALTKENTWGLLQKIKHIYKDVLFCTLIFLAVQIPYMIFYSAYGIDYGNMVGLELFYVVDLAMYELTNHAFLGFALNGILFFVLSVVLRLLVLRRWDKERV